MRELLQLDQVPADRRFGAPEARRVLDDERRVLRSGAIDRLARLDDQAVDRARRPGAAGEHVHGADDVRLVRRPVLARRVDHDGQVHDCVDSQLANQLADHRLPRVRVDEIHLLQGAHRISRSPPLGRVSAVRPLTGIPALRRSGG